MKTMADMEAQGGNLWESSLLKVVPKFKFSPYSVNGSTSKVQEVHLYIKNKQYLKDGMSFDDTLVDLDDEVIGFVTFSRLEVGKDLTDPIVNAFLKLVDMDHIKWEEISTCGKEYELAIYTTLFCNFVCPEKFLGNQGGLRMGANMYNFDKAKRFQPIHQCKMSAKPFDYNVLLIPINFTDIIGN